MTYNCNVDLPPPVRKMVRDYLSTDPDAQDAPILLRQRAIYHATAKVLPLAGLDALVPGENGDSIQPLTVDIATDASAQIVLALSETIRLAVDFAKIARQAEIEHDNYMMDPVILEILHFPFGFALGWEFSEKRLNKLLAFQNGDPQAPGALNNPTSALGVFIHKAPNTGHEKVALSSFIKDSYARFARYTTLRTAGRVATRQSMQS